MSVQLEEFIHQSIHQARQTSGEAHVKLGAPPALVEEIRHILEGEDVDVTQYWIVDMKTGDSSGDQFSIRSGKRHLGTCWIPGLDREGLEMYQTLRRDGTPWRRALQLVETLNEEAAPAQ